jgi:Trk K+ transport system NAD-binding subunit
VIGFPATTAVKFLPSQLAYLVATRETRANLRALAKYLALLAALMVVFAVLFHVIMLRVEGQQHSWITGLYWTLVVMTTLGFGDITFTSDLGRLFSIVVLVSGVIFLLVMLPFLFVRLFYAPWLEARIRFRAPRAAPAGTAGHVILTQYDAVAAVLAARLRTENIPYFFIESDPAVAARLVDDGVSAILGDQDSRSTYEQLQVRDARLVLANDSDEANANITLTVREAAPSVPVAAIVEEVDAVDILQLSGATRVLPLKQRLGESLANRADTGGVGAHVIGAVGDVQIAELPAGDTPFVGLTLRETRLRERTGLNVVGLWERGRLQPAYPDARVDPNGVIVLAGTASQIAALDGLVPRPAAAKAVPRVLIIGAGTVGRAAAVALRRKGVRVAAVDRDAVALASLARDVDVAVTGNAADRRCLAEAGLHETESVLLTTNSDAVNIFLALFCRRLKPDLRLVSRITHERNVEAIHRAGADFVLSYTSLAIDAVMSFLNDRETVLLGEGVEMFALPVPTGLAGRTLGGSGIGSRTGLSVVAVRQAGRLFAELNADTILPEAGELLMLGSVEQRKTFADLFEKPAAR